MDVSRAINDAAISIASASHLSALACTFIIRIRESLL